MEWELPILEIGKGSIGINLLWRGMESAELLVEDVKGVLTRLNQPIGWGIATNAGIRRKW